jgi:protein involved in polysaccharide export with SLBB domain
MKPQISTLRGSMRSALALLALMPALAFAQAQQTLQPPASAAVPPAQAAAAARMLASQQPPQPPPMPALASPPADYRLQYGDVLDIKFFYNPELNETIPVRTDGRISLQLIGDVDVSGLTPADLRAELMKRYAGTLKQPEVAVIVRTMAPRRIYVGGEVNTPGLLQMADRLTLLQGVFEAGGFKRSSKVSNVVVLRYQGTNQPKFMTVNLEPALKKGDPRADIALEPYDIVWVPKTKIAKADDFMDQYFRQLVPIPLSLGVSYVWGSAIR